MARRHVDARQREERYKLIELHRAMGVTQKTAWFMLQRLKLAMQQGSFEKLSGEVEADETFVGGKARNMHKKKREEKIQGRGSSGRLSSWVY